MILSLLSRPFSSGLLLLIGAALLTGCDTHSPFIASPLPLINRLSPDQSARRPGGVAQGTPSPAGNPVSPVPEPSPSVIWAAGAMGLAFLSLRAHRCRLGGR